MVDILEFIEDLERLKKLAGSAASPTFHSSVDSMLHDYKERAWLYEKDMEQQEDLFDNVPI
jgi:hypothetical protein